MRGHARTRKASEWRRLHTTAEVLRDDHAAVRAFLGTLIDPRRALPVVLVSARRENDRPIIDADQVADWLSGLAHVWVEENRFPSTKLRSAGLPDRLRAWEGAVRVYWPRFTLFDEAYEHPFWAPEHVARLEAARANGFRESLLGRIAQIAQYSVFPGDLRWTDLEGMDRARAMRELQAKGDDRALLDLAIQDIDAKNRTIQELTQQAAELSAKLSTVAQQEAFWKQQYLDRVASSSSPSVPAEAPPDLPDVEAAVELAQDRFRDRLLFALNGKSHVKRNPFDSPDDVFAALHFLATEYWDARIAGSDGADFDHELRRRCGWFYKGSQGETTTSKYREWYTANANGRSYVLDKHVGTGSSRDPRFTIRIGFDWDADLERVVIGYIGQHPRTDAS